VDGEGAGILPEAGERMSLKRRLAHLERDQAPPHRCRMVMTSREHPRGTALTFACACGQASCRIPTLRVIVKPTPAMEGIPP
jgi:hypothetical protein